MPMAISIEWIAAAILVLLLVRSIRIAAENQRYAVFRLGRFVGLRGPGLLLKLPGMGSRWVRLSVGKRGELVTPGIGEFSGVQVPVQVETDGSSPGAAIRIISFSGDAVSAVLDG